MRRSLLVALACCALGAAPAGPAAAAPAPSSSVRIAFTMPTGERDVWPNAAAGCLSLSGGWSRASTPRFTGGSLRPRGLLDVSGRSGEAIVPGEAINVERILFAPSRALAAFDVGLQLAGRDAYLSGTIRRGRLLTAKAPPRRRLARLHGAKLAYRTVRGRLVVTVTGRATMLAPLASMFEELRCKGPRLSGRPIRVGAALGKVTATIQPAGATGVLASLGAAVLVGGAADPPPGVEATGGAQTSASGIRFATAERPRLEASCVSDRCEPSGGSVQLVGGFDFVAGAQRLSLTNLSIAFAGEQRTVTATVGGVSIPVAAGPAHGLLAFSDELRARLVATFGDAELDGSLSGIDLPFGHLAPA